MAAHLRIVYGCMFSGKTTLLTNELRKATHARKRCVLIKPRADTRDVQDDKSLLVSSHDKLAYTGDTRHVDSEELVTMDIDAPSAFGAGRVGVIGIDEAQFFGTLHLVEAVRFWLNEGRQVIVAGLNLDFRKERFDWLETLEADATYVDKCRAICHECGGETGIYSRRTVDSDEKILIGGDEAYVALCRDCDVACYKNEKNTPSGAVV